MSTINKMLGCFSIIFLITAVIGCFAFFGVQRNAEAKLFVDAAVPDILQHLDKETLLRYISSEISNDITDEKINDMFFTVRKLGKFLNYEGAKGATHSSTIIGKGTKTTASYSTTSKFELGDLITQVALVKNEDKWKLSGIHFYFDASLLLKDETKTANP